MKSWASESKPFQTCPIGETPGRARRKERLSLSKLKQAFLIDSDAELFMHFSCTWHNALTEVLDRHMPIKKLRVRKKDAPYITREWKEAIRKKRKYAKRHKKLQTEESDQLRKKWRNIATSIRRKAIKQYWKERSDEHRTNPRTFFKTLTPFLRDKGCGEAAVHLKEGNNIVRPRPV